MTLWKHTFLLPTTKAHAPLQISRARSTVPFCLWSDFRSFSATAAPSECSGISCDHARPIPGVGGGNQSAKSVLAQQHPSPIFSFFTSPCPSFQPSSSVPSISWLYPHSMDPVKVLAFARILGARPIHTLIIGCEPATIITGEEYTDTQMVLSEPVGASAYAWIHSDSVSITARYPRYLRMQSIWYNGHTRWTV